MRKRHTVPMTVKNLMKMILNEEVSFNHPVQRPKGQWTDLQESLLIRSILIDYDVPSVYAVEDKTDNEAVYSIIDGKQRLSVLFEFVNNQFDLHKDTPPVSVEGREYDIAQSSYEELPEHLRELINDYNLNMIYFANITDDEVFEMFHYLNNGTPLSTQHKAISKMGVDATLFIKELASSEFAQSKLKLTDGQRKKSEDELVLEQAMMLLDEDYKLSKFNAKDASSYMETVIEKDKSFLDKIKSVIAYLDLAYMNNEGGVELKKVHAPMLIATASKAVGNIEPEKFYEWTKSLSEFISDKESEYAQYVGNSSTNKGKVEGRYNLIQNHFDEHFNLVQASAN